jgi:hypothetical protein
VVAAGDRITAQAVDLGGVSGKSVYEVVGWVNLIRMAWEWVLFEAYMEYFK